MLSLFPVLFKSSNWLYRKFPALSQLQHQLYPLRFWTLCLMLLSFSPFELYAATSTTTSLALDRSSAPAGSPITLTATVTATEGTNISGQVVFCDASTSHCEDTAVLGTAQLVSGSTNSGTASLSRIFASGQHSVYAVFRGTATYAGSTSGTQTVTIQGKLPSTTTFSSSGGSNNQQLTATVVGQGRPAITGQVSFAAATNGNQALGTSSLGTSTISYGFTPLPTSSTGVAQFVTVADVNNDGLPDLITARQNNYVSNGTFDIQLADPAHFGQFLAPVTYNLDGSPVGVVSGDFNNDGVLDLIFLLGTDYPSGLDQGKIEVFLGDPVQHGQFQVGGTFSAGVINDSAQEPLNAAITVGDFNHDGVLDVALLNNGDTGTIGFMFGNPAHLGSFQPLTSISLGNYFPDIIKTADFNGDGFPDLLLGTIYGSQVTIILADPNSPGQFLPLVNYPVTTPSSNTSSRIFIGDMNGDGLPDVVVPQSQSVAVLLNNPAVPGTLLPSQSYASASPLGASAIGDFNGDGILDVASLRTNGLQVMYGSSALPGMLSPPVTYNINLPFGSISATDFNGDGISDLAAWSGFNSTIQVALGSVLQTGTASVTIPGTPGNLAEAIYSGDSNYDGQGSCYLDASTPESTAPVISGVTVTNVTSTSVTISWTTNIFTNGEVDYGTTSSLGVATPWISPPSTRHFFTLTNLVPGTAYSYQIRSVAFSNGCNPWTVATPVTTFTTSLPSHASTQTTLTINTAYSPVILTATVASDGQSVKNGLVKFCDGLSTLCEGNSVLGSAQLQSDGTAVLRIFTPLTPSVYALFTGDLAYNSSSSAVQNFGTPFVLLPTTTTISKSGNGPQYTLTASVTGSGTHGPTGSVMFIADATGAQLGTATFNSSSNTITFSSPIANSVLPEQFNSIVTGDINNDGATDIVAFGSTAGTTGSFYTFLGTPSLPGHFRLAYGPFSPGEVPLDLVDLNGDGVLDLVAIGSPGGGTGNATLQLFYGDPVYSGYFNQGPSYSVPTGIYSVVHGDFNGDGFPDLAVGIIAQSGNDQLGIFLNDVTHPGQLIAGSTNPLSAPVTIVAGDFNNDGLTDVAAVDAADSNIWLYLADPANPGQFLSHTTLATGGRPSTIVTSDFNNDGVLDLATANGGSTANAPTSMSILLGDPAHPGQFLPQTTYSAFLNAKASQIPLFVTDFNGDGLSDLLSLNNTSLTILSGDPAHPGQFLPQTTQALSGAPSSFDSSAVATLSASSLPSLLFFTSSSAQIVIINAEQTISATTAPVTVQTQGSSLLAHAQYSGDALYYGGTSCSINLSTTPAAPIISGVTVSNVSPNYATVSWTTDVPTMGYVQFGTNSTMNEQTPENYQLSTTHSFVINLLSNTTYTYQVAAVAFFSGCTHWTAFSTPATFTTPAQ